jgi:hypothetical protein
MLTDQEIRVFVEKQIGVDANYKCSLEIEFAREIIEANNAKVLADLKPLLLVSGEDSCGRAVMVKPLTNVYSADKVSALIQRNEALEARVKDLEAWLEGDATCPCCCQSVTCVDGCTFAADAPHNHDKMQEVRNILKATP